MMVKFHRAKEARAPFVELWGTGSPLREFLHSDDLAEALVVLMDRYDESTTINVGSGTDLPIKELARRIAYTVGYTGEIRFNSAYPDGTPKKLMDSSRMGALGWQPRVELEIGLQQAYAWALDNNAIS
jgi:GDP-L-fucose synthase